MTQSTFTNFRYEVSKAPLDKTRVVMVTFDYNGQHIKKIIILKEKNGANYVAIAQKQIEKEFHNGELEKYSERYIKNGGNAAPAKPALIVTLSIVTAAVLALTGLSVYKFFFAPNSGGGGGGGEPTATYYQVNFDSEGGTSIPSQQIKEGQKATEPKKPTKDGCEFDNWYPSQSSTEPFKFDTAITANVTLYARWTTNTYSVTFKTDGGTWEKQKDSEPRVVDNIEYGAIPDPDDTLTKTGYTFTGWTPALKPVIRSGDEYTAVWASVATYFTVSFDTDGGTSIPAQKIELGKFATKPTSDPDKTGYHFDGWFTDPSGQTQWDFEHRPINDNVTIYAHWRKNKFSVQFNPNGGTWHSGSTEPKIVYDVEYGSIPKPGEELNRTGYTFTGWSPELEPVTAEGAIYTAQWIASDYCTVTFDTQGGPTIEAKKVLKGGKVAKPTDPSWTGHHFDGWFKEVGESAGWDFDDSINADVTIYAHWTINKLTANFNPNGGKWSDQSIEIKPVEVEYGKIADPNDTPTKTGYTFKGWDPKLGPVTETGEVYTAQWVASSYFTVTFDTQGGTSVSAQKVLEGEKATLPTPEPTKKGYDFDGWHKEKETASPWDFEHTPITDNVTIYAHWTINKYNIHFDPNGGKWSSGSTVTKTIENVEYGTMADPGEDNPTRDGYTFIGWDKPLKPVTGEETYKAQWVESTYFTVTFDTQGGTSVEAEKVLKGGHATRPVNDPEKEGCEFAGWFKAESGEDIWDFDTTPINKNEVIYAHWNTKSFNITFRVDGGKWTKTGSTEDKTMNLKYGVMADPNDTLTKDGYTFNGWTPKLEKVTGTAEYTALWKVQTRAISIDPNGGTFTDGTASVKLIDVDYGKTWAEILNDPDYADIQIKEPLPSGMVGYTYNYLDQGEWKPIQDADIITSNLALKVIYIPVAPSNFSTDSWETFITCINSYSFDGLKSGPYKAAYESTEGDKKANTFVGLTRTITIDTADYTVRVIGENTSAGQSDAKFTFEFEQVLDLEVPYSLDPNNNSYKDSFINKNLDKIFQYELPTVVRENIKPTTIKYYATQQEEPTVEDLEDVKLFVLSASELGFSEFPDPDGLSVPAEGDTYQYYTYATSSKIKKTISGAAVKYWTRTPDITGAEEAAWNIDGNGALGTDGASIATNTGEVYIAPAFRL